MTVLETGFMPRIPLGQAAEAGIDWISANLGWLLDAIKVGLGSANDVLVTGLLAVPPALMILLLALLAWAARSWQMAAGTLVGLLLVMGLNQWDHAMETLGLVLIATVTAILIAVPLGIWAARHDTVSTVMKPILDFMQTMPAFVYLIPTIIFFSVGVVPGLVSTIIFALPPGVRLTELGIRHVDAETVEAGLAFGASPGQILRGIQLPLAVPSIMAGINQVIMLALSMAVIAGMVGADGLGKEVVGALSTINTPRGVEAGLSIVVLAIYLDRVTAALGAPSAHPRSLIRLLTTRRARSATASA